MGLLTLLCLSMVAQGGPSINSSSFLHWKGTSPPMSKLCSNPANSLPLATCGSLPVCTGGLTHLSNTDGWRSLIRIQAFVQVIPRLQITAQPRRRVQLQVGISHWPWMFPPLHWGEVNLEKTRNIVLLGEGWAKKDMFSSVKHRETTEGREAHKF